MYLVFYLVVVWMPVAPMLHHASHDATRWWGTAWGISSQLEKDCLLFPGYLCLQKNASKPGNKEIVKSFCGWLPDVDRQSSSLTPRVVNSH
jgi:hypothetical protein